MKRHVEVFHELKRCFLVIRPTWDRSSQEDDSVTTANLLRGEVFFVDCLENAAWAHHLLGICAEMLVR